MFGMTFRCLLSSGGVYVGNQVHCLRLAFMMHDDNTQMKSLRTQGDVRLNFGSDARCRNTTFLSLLTSATHSIHSSLISP